MFHSTVLTSPSILYCRIRNYIISFLQGCLCSWWTHIFTQHFYADHAYKYGHFVCGTFISLLLQQSRNSLLLFHHLHMYYIFADQSLQPVKKLSLDRVVFGRGIRCVIEWFREITMADQWGTGLVNRKTADDGITK